MGVHGRELWRSDGSPGGTSLVVDLDPGLNGGVFEGPLPLHGRLLFDGFDATQVSLWRSDGTVEGTVPIALNITPYLSNATELNGSLFFPAYDDPHGSELWCSDGTAAGTGLVKDIVPGTGGSYPQSLVAADGVVLFAASEDAAGTELWRSDGTAAGTLRVKDISPGTRGSSPRALTSVGRTAFFTADDGAHGIELWRTDGTAEGTALVADINPGAASASPASLTDAGGIPTSRPTTGSAAPNSGAATERQQERGASSTFARACWAPRPSCWRPSTRQCSCSRTTALTASSSGERRD
jgi:ELWxxDGT repeat protein